MPPQNYIIKPNNSSLLIIDIQEKLFAAMPEKVQKSLIKNISILVKTGNEFSLPILVSEQYRKGLGPTLSPVLDILKNQKILEKIHFNCIKDTEIKKQVESQQKKAIIIAGIESHICVLQTALGLLEMGHTVIIAGDAVASRSEDNWKMSLDAMRSAGCIIYPTETIAFMLLEKAGTEEFKKISPLFK